MYFITQTYAVNGGQVSKVCFDADAVGVAPGKYGTGASSSRPTRHVSRSTTTLATPAPALPAPAGKADHGTCGVTQSITFYTQKPTELQSSSSSVLQSRGYPLPQSSC